MDKDPAPRKRTKPPPIVKAPRLVEHLDRADAEAAERKSRAERLAKQSKRLGVTRQSLAAAETFADALSAAVDPKAVRTIRSELVEQLRRFEESDRQLTEPADETLSSVISDIKISKVKIDRQESEWVDRTVRRASAFVEHDQEHAGWSERPDWGQRRRPRSSLQSLEHQAVELFGAPPLGIFSATAAAAESDPEPTLPNWRRLQLDEIALQLDRTPRNAFDEQREWSERGQLWRFPIDNFQDKEPDAPWFEHIFLDNLIDDFPKSGPIRTFMEIVVYSLSDNSWLTAAEKRERVNWFRRFFKARQEMLDRGLGGEQSCFAERAPDEAQRDEEAARNAPHYEII